MQDINSYLFESLLKQQIDEDLSFMLDDQIDEGKFKDGIKKVWNWVKNKFKKPKSNKTTNKEETNSVDSSSSDNKSFSYKFYDYGQIIDKIYKNNNLKKGIKIVDKGYDNDYKILCCENDNNIIACLFFLYPEKYKRPTDFETYQNYAHIFSMQIDENYFGNHIGEELIKILFKKVFEKSSCKGITLDYNEYKTKNKLYDKYFEIINVKKDKYIGINKK
jgi:hypothetical protein